MVQGVRQPDHPGSRQRVLHALCPRRRHPGQGRRRREAGAAHRDSGGHGLARGAAPLFRGAVSRQAAEPRTMAPIMEPKRFRDLGDSMKKACVIGSLLVVLTLSLGGSAVSKGTDTGATYEQLRLFTEVLSIVQNQYVDEVPPKELIYSAIKGTLRGLDPHSSFLDPGSYKEMQVETSGSFGGLGIEITVRDDILTVVAPIDGTPAYRAGLQPGDKIVKIDGIVTKDMQLPDAVKKMRGKPGSKVTISVVREGWTEPHDFEIQREQIRVHSVRSQDLGSGIAYIKLRQFQEQTAHDLEAALEKFNKGEFKGLILDLRNNPGGLLTSAVEVSEKFVDDGKLVVYTESRVRKQNMRFSAHAKHAFST